MLLTFEKSEGATQASCKTIKRKWKWDNKKQNLKTCDPEVTRVDDENFAIKSDMASTTTGFYFADMRDIKFLPTHLNHSLPALVALQVFNCSVTSVNENNFKGLSQLKVLNLFHNLIEHVTSNAFQDLERLEYLDLSSNKIRSLRENTFITLKALEILLLAGNDIQLIQLEMFRSLVNLHTLNLSGNSIYIIEGNIFDTLVNMKIILFNDNELEKIPNNLFKNNSRLQMISLKQNKIKFIDSDMFDNLSTLKVVALMDNVCINKSYENNFDVMRSDLKQNCTESLIQADAKSLIKQHEKEDPGLHSPTQPSITTSSQQLTSTHPPTTVAQSETTNKHFSSTQGESINFFQIDLNFSMMLVLGFKHVFCTSKIQKGHFQPKLDACIVNQTIDSDNFVIGSPIDITIELFLIRNIKEVKFLPQRILAKLPNLKEYYVYDCGIDVLRRECFKNMKHLQYLYLAFNSISSIETFAFNDLVKVIELNLDHNLIETIDNKLFDKMINLKTIHLSNNKIKFLDQKIFMIPGGKIEQVFMGSNFCIDGDYDSKNSKQLEADLKSKCTGQKS